MTRKNKIRWSFSILLLIVLVVAFRTGCRHVKKDLASPQPRSTKRILQDELKQMIIAASDSLYELQFSTFQLNIDAGKALIKDLRLIADSTVYEKLLRQHRAPNVRIDFKADSIVIDHFGFVSTRDGKQLVVNNMLLQNPVVNIRYAPLQYNDTTHTATSLFAAAFKKLMKLAVVKQLEMKNLDFGMTNESTGFKRKTGLHNIDIKMNGIDITSVKENDTSGDTHTLIKVAGYRLTTGDKLYTMTMNNLRLNVQEKSAAIEKAVVAPSYNKASFFNSVSKANARFYFVYNNMQMQGIDYNRLLNMQQIHVRKITAGSSFTEIYTDYGLRKRKPPVRTHGFPHQLLQQLAFDITVDTMLMHNGGLRYEMKTNTSGEVALFKMDNIESKITNLTNNANTKRVNHFTTAITKGTVMDAANITSTLQFDLTDKKGAFRLKSVLDPMNGTMLNPLTKPLALLEIRWLDIQKMITTVAGNEQSVTGNIDFYYKNMKVALLKKKDDNYKRSGLVSAISNVLVPDDNPKRNGKFRKGPINIKRQPTESFFGYLWLAMFDGMTAHMTGVEKTKVKRG